MKNDYAVEIEIEKVFNNEQVHVGYVYKLRGTFVYGVPVSTITKIRDQIGKLRDESMTDLVAIDTSELVRWDSIGVTSVIEPVIEANRLLAKKNRTPIHLIGEISNENDRFKAVKDKFPDLNNTNALPWMPSIEEWQKKFVT